MPAGLMPLNISDGLPEHRPDSPDNPQRLLASQLAIAVALGVSALLSFCMLRRQYPQVYEARRLRKKDLPDLGTGWFSWMKKLHEITDEEVIEHAGLDAYVFLGFFKTSMQLLAIMAVLAAAVISPIRWHYTGRYDQSDDGMATIFKKPKQPPESYENYLWTYVVFTYIFTGLTAFFMVRQTVNVLQVRQRYLGQQNSITDRTIKLSGIPAELRSDSALKDYIEALGIGQVRKVELCLNFSHLDHLFGKRNKLIDILEHAWADYLDHTIVSLADNGSPSQYGSVRLPDTESDTPVDCLTNRNKKRPTLRLGLFGIFGEKVDLIDHYTAKLQALDAEIERARGRESYDPIDTAFVTMDSVASAQMAAQAVLDPRPQRLIAHPAPAPHDIVWHNLYISKPERMLREYGIMAIIAVLTVIFVVPVSYLASLLNPKTIEKIWPGLYNVIDWDGWIGTFITGILPPLIFTLFNFMFPFLYLYLSTKQGFFSYGDIELSVVSKNFFYVFFNMFLVFTVVGTVGDVWALLKDTTKIAIKLARSLSKFSLFYVDLIILQGIGMFPFRLVQIGSILKFPVVMVQKQSARDLRNLWRPPVFNYGITLPQPILILIIVLLYSVISSKIVFFGCLYFSIGYYVYKYQLMFSMVRPMHSTGRSWITIMRRVIIGIILFHLTMTGILILQSAYLLAGVLAPLPIATFLYWHNFEEDYVPLSSFIALTAISTTGSGSTSSAASVIADDASPNNDDDGSTTTPLLSTTTTRLRRKTFDEEREKNMKFVNPNLVRELDGPWVGLDIKHPEFIIMATADGSIQKKRVPDREEWE